MIHESSNNQSKLRSNNCFSTIFRFRDHDRHQNTKD